MAVVPLIFDCRTRCPASGSISLLELPLGTGTFLDELTSRVERIDERGERELLILTTAEQNEQRQHRLSAGSSYPVRVIHPDQLPGLLDGYEPTDQLVAIDPAHWPIGRFDLAAMLRRYRHYGGATHLVAVGHDGDLTRERVEHDQGGRVRRIQRFYNRVLWPEVADTLLIASFVPIGAINKTPFDSLPALRTALARRGVFAQDVPLFIDVMELTAADGVLALNEYIVDQSVQKHTHARFAGSGDVLVSRDSEIHPSARLIGPVIIHERTRIDASAAVIGPAVIGPDCHLEQDSIVAAAVLAPSTILAPGAVVQHRVAWGYCSAQVDEESASMLSDAAPVHLRPMREQPDATPSWLGPTTVDSQSRKVQLIIKRILDILLSSVGLVVLSPLLILAALLIKITSPGPVFFVHRRERRSGGEFPCIKFRTMVDQAHDVQRAMYSQSEVDGPHFKIRSDPRVTPLGRFLRMSNIDEMPQLFNVLAGHMGLVGPRPSPFRENQICVPWRRARLSVRPGITGLWQICRSDDWTAGGFHEWIYYDITYVRHFSLWLDFKILLATVLTMGGRRNVPLSWLIGRSSPPSTPAGAAAV